jgi:hypothetical protein
MWLYRSGLATNVGFVPFLWKSLWYARSMRKTLAWGALLVGIICLVVGVVYWTIPAGSLPSFMPGYEAGVAATHFKHGLAAVIVGLALLVYAWFTSVPKRT